MVSGLNLDVWGAKTKHLAPDVLRKSTVGDVGILMIFSSFFYDFGWRWDQFFMIVAGLEAGFKFGDFPR